MPRNKLMGAIALLAAALLLAAVAGTYRLFSYLSALLIVAMVGAASIERASREFDLAPYGGLVAGLTAVFLVGLTGIWSLWSPETTEYSYALGLPSSTLVYVVFIWLLPVLASVYYAVVFSAVGSDEIVDDIVETADRVQRERELPLSPRRVEAESDGGREP
ncbi:hypothetical protein [Halegenticoccus tardaugens]|uniref:hypothetical protein n=1 Tax=Halegenticoccus tardaugens TaxID=2071624 RepID=UPI00100A2AB3|nr:hypothetical protein [Halegenticoccus tardaugens]